MQIARILKQETKIDVRARMIRSVMIVGRYGRLIYAHEFMPTDSFRKSTQGIGALVSIIHKTSPILIGSKIKRIRLAEEELLVNANDSLIFAMSTTDGPPNDYQRKLDLFVDTFMAKYAEIIPYLNENTNLEIFDDLTTFLENEFFS